MLVVKVELHSAITGAVSELGRLIISNDGKSMARSVGNYDVRLGRKGAAENHAILTKPQRQGRVEGHARLSAPVWSLVAKALASIGFRGQPREELRWAANCHRCGCTVEIGGVPDEEGGDHA